MQIVEAILGDIRQADGSSRAADLSTPPNWGFMVSLLGHEKIVAGAVDKQTLTEYVAAKLPLLATSGNYIGVWQNDNQTYLDVSHWVASQFDAELIGIVNKQIAIWDCEKKQAITL